MVKHACSDENDEVSDWTYPDVNVEFLTIDFETGFYNMIRYVVD